jgi:CHAT domain-containing protein
LARETLKPGDNPAEAMLPALATLAAEPCRLGPPRPTGRFQATGTVRNLRCADNDSGALVHYLAPTRVSGARMTASSAKALDTLRSGALQGLALDCQSPVPFALAGREGPTLFAQACRQLADNWPYLVLSRHEPDAIRIAHGPADAAPALIALLTGQTAPDADLPRRLGALWSPALPLAGLAEQGRVRRAWARGRLAATTFHYARAERDLQEAYALQTQISNDADPLTSTILSDLALVVTLSGRLEEGEALLARASALLAQSPRASDQARLSGYRAQAAAARGDYDLALREAAGAVSKWRQLADPQAAVSSTARDGTGDALARAELASALNLEASITLRSGDPASAAVRASEALLTFDQLETAPSWWRAEILGTLGEAMAQLGRMAAAEKHLQAALRIRQEAFGDDVGCLRLWLTLGRSYHVDGLHTNAVLAFRNAMALAARLPRESLPLSDQDLVPFAQSIHQLSGSITDPLELQGLRAELFAAFQLARSADREHINNLAAAQLAQQTPDLAALLNALSSADLERVRLRTSLALARTTVEESMGPAALLDLQTELEAVERRIADGNAALAERFPRYRSLVQSGLYRLDDVRARLAPGEALAMFLVGRDQSFLQLVRRDGLELIPIAAGEASLTDTVRRLRRGLEIESGSVSEFDLGAAHALYQDLFGRSGEVLRGVARLTVIPSGPLSGLPFGILVQKPVPQGRYSEAAWLVQSLPVSHTPTLTSFMALRSTRVARRAPRLMLAIANPAVTGTISAGASLGGAFASCRGSQPVDPELLRSLAPLPETEREAASVARSLGATDAEILAGASATETALRQKNLADYRVLYFATHGLIPGELQCQTEPGIVLTPPAAPVATRSSDGLLDASEIASLSLQADLVVLSACNTAAPQGARAGTGGLSGLADAFFRAGARSVLASHWQVPSAATQQLMQTTFLGLGQSAELALDEALRRAQVEAIRQPKTAHPFFWGAFVILGDGNAPGLAARSVP